MNKEIKDRRQCMVDTHEPVSSKKILTSNMVASTCKYCGKSIIASLYNYIWLADE